MDIQRLLNTDRFAADVGIRLVSAGNGEAVLALDLEERHLNGNSVAQGGVIFTLADTAFAVAMNNPERDAVSLDCAITFLRPAPLGTLTAHAVTVSAGRRTCSVEVRVTDGQGRLVARMQGTGFVTN